MLYREMGKTGDLVSNLGFGCLRLPQKDKKIDQKRAEKLIITAIEKGVNYFDTAYIYPNSEVFLGKVLAKAYRDKVMIATKMPPIMVHSQKDMALMLTKQLRRLQTDHIDYYLLHSLNSGEGWQRMKQLGVEEFIKNAQQSGKINRIGFSYHGDSDNFKEIVDDYPWDFCQIQYNYLDEKTQAGKVGLEYAAAKGLGVSIMEPLRGGLLAHRIPSQVQALFDEAQGKRTPAEWALRWVWNHAEVSVVLSGMNEEFQIEENIRIASDVYPQSLTASDQRIISKAREIFARQVKVGCTGCGYCMPCPSGVNIPMSFGYYNDKYLYKAKSAQTSYLGMLGGMDGGTPAYASLCRNCGKCEQHCPQSLPVRKHLREVAKDMEPFYFKPAVRIVQRYYALRKLFKK